MFTALYITRFSSIRVKLYTIMCDDNRIIAMLEKTGTLKIASVGDCGLKVIRKGAYGKYMYLKVISMLASYQF
jgi:hypothetical protein